MSPLKLAVPTKGKERRLAAKPPAGATESKADHRNAKAKVLGPRMARKNGPRSSLTKEAISLLQAAAELESKDYAKGGHNSPSSQSVRYSSCTNTWADLAEVRRCQLMSWAAANIVNSLPAS